MYIFFLLLISNLFCHVHSSVRLWLLVGRSHFDRGLHNNNDDSKKEIKKIKKKLPCQKPWTLIKYYICIYIYIYSRSLIIRNSINRKVRLTGLHGKKNFKKLQHGSSVKMIQEEYNVGKSTIYDLKSDNMVMEDKLLPSQIYKADETGLFYLFHF